MDAGEAFYERMKADATLKTLLGTYSDGFARVQADWPEDFTVEADFPLVSLLVPSDRSIRTGVRSFEVQADVFVWPDGASGGPARVEAIDERLLVLFDEAVWTYDNVRWQSNTLVATEHPGGPDVAFRKMRRFNVLGSALS